jgi:peptide/nickel transport system permease protein
MRGARLPLFFLGALYLAALGASFLAPYGFAEQHRRHPLAPPTGVHFFDAEGRFHLRPFVYAPVSGDAVGERHPLRFFWREETEALPGLVEAPRRRLIGVEKPGVLFLLGTDELGRDQFSRLLYGARVSLFAGVLAGLLAVALGTFLGALAGFFGGWVDELLMRIVELALALPWLYLLLLARAFLPLHLDPVQSFLLVVCAIAAIGWAAPARLVRGVALSVTSSPMVEAARSTGVRPLGILLRCVIPQALPVALTQLALAIPQFILAEVTLSFLNLGVGEPVPSWGSMLGALQNYHVLVSAWWMGLPAVALGLVILSYHQLSNVLQRRLNPMVV